LDEASSKRQHDYLKNPVSLTNASPSLDEIVRGGHITLDLFFAIKGTF
jgi:hypothetical protein